MGKARLKFDIREYADSSEPNPRANVIKGREKPAKIGKFDRPEQEPLGMVSATWPIDNGIGIQPENTSIRFSNHWIRSTETRKSSALRIKL